MLYEMNNGFAGCRFGATLSLGEEYNFVCNEDTYTNTPDAEVIIFYHAASDDVEVMIDKELVLGNLYVLKRQN